MGESWRDPGRTLHDNVAMALNVLEAVRHEAPEATVVAVASGEVYGPPARLPVDETAPLRPQNPYAVSKASADLLAGFFADAHGLLVVTVADAGVTAMTAFVGDGVVPRFGLPASDDPSGAAVSGRA